MDDRILELQLPREGHLPRALAALTAYTRAAGTDYLTDTIRLADDGPDDLAAWTRAAPTLASSLWVFAKDSTHALFALWMRDSEDLEASPVIRLDSEGVENNLVAANLTDFAWKLAKGQIDGQPTSGRLIEFLRAHIPDPPSTVPDPRADDRLNAWIRAGMEQATSGPAS